MKKSRFCETQIINAIREYEAGKSAADLSRAWDKQVNFLQLA
ncbi:hypothetical protein [Pollutibacter soli]